MPVYLDCNATTPLEPCVWEVMVPYFLEDFGNAGSRTHDFGARAKRAVQRARQQVASVVAASPDEIVFTSGATESNNLAILGLAAYGKREGRTHIISTQIEHKAMLEPLAWLRGEGFEVDLVPPTDGGWVEPEAILRLLRPTTLLVSVMHVNNETGVIQPIEEVAEGLEGHPAFFHTDAAQGFGKELPPLRNPRIDLISISGHKIFGPKGIGALVTRRRGYERPPLEPLVHGGGQERGLRSGTLPVPLIVGLGEAAELAGKEHQARRQRCQELCAAAMDALSPFAPALNGDPSRALPNTLNISIPGLDSETLILTLKDVAAISNGSACTSRHYSPSHVLAAMGLTPARIDEAVRISWCHLTGHIAWGAIATRLRALQPDVAAIAHSAGRGGTLD